MKKPPTGIRLGVLLGGLVAALGAALYPIAIHPYLHIDEYKEIQKESRKNIDQASVQPGGMKVWSDPFERR